MRTPLKSIATAALTRQLPILPILLIGAIGVQTITSCSGGDADDLPCVTCEDDGGGSSPSSGNNSSSSGAGNGGGGGDSNGEGIIIRYDIEKIEGSDTEGSVTTVGKSYDCKDGRLEKEIHRNDHNYSINGTILSFRGREFSGNSSSLIGTWTSDISCKENDDYCNTEVYSKAVFTQNTLTITMCKGKIGEYERTENDVVVGKKKVIDCGTVEETRGTQTVRIKYYGLGSGTEVAITYNDKTCKTPFEGSHSEPQMEKACKDAYDNGGDYYDILRKEVNDCLKDNNFPEWIN